ncbi:hypothetical protein D8M04_19790 [Oceanobacillus piezotolerans]|uniref:Uncharacterized protein n=2 Tax=Oceanobacillus piezotolerans TaxID=2448030 RepID=A0A498D5N5_9BACI|nr:hypothetical protein [Oceanobacillus piezotolerans]RLL39956.1 hypothetical protein D8M04_19790 [Oceanobacillus piezotolerans]
MLGLLLKDMEQKEIEYLLKRELDEILNDLEDPRVNKKLKESMRTRYKRLFKLLCRMCNEKDRTKYMLKTGEKEYR